MKSVFAIFDERGQLAGEMYHRTRKQARGVMTGLESAFPNMTLQVLAVRMRGGKLHHRNAGDVR